MNKKRITAVLALAAATGITAVIAVKLGINPPVGNIIGSFCSIAALVVFAALLKVKDNLFYCGLVFVYCASPVGSVLNLYRSVGPYDKIVHFFSGILLAWLAAVLLSRIFDKAVASVKNNKLYMLLQCGFAFFFSSAGAGIWEIFEFTTDRLTGGEMQRGMVDTVTDIIAGNTGALTYCVICAILICSGRLSGREQKDIESE